ncbi:site-specific integrase [Streptomyces virginiae]|uniref:site-specific integrase n=1 Tax=Streptomyces virginiae TaxID=1961 RepID=UPI002DB89CF1|nr:site-specific integrase [Streptomyces sp. CMAA1738]MEC4575790.1 site-specific integrase [Streptomyces sp. CMAA1738]
MLGTGGSARDLVSFVLPESGELARSTDQARPYVLLDAAGAVAEPVERFFAELQACGRPPATVRSYGMDLLRWWRFLDGWGLAWDRVTRVDARDFARWMQVAPKPVRVH